VSPLAPTLHGPIIGERYQIIGHLGAGGAAEVHEAIDLKIGRPIAIKTLRLVHRGLVDVRQRLLREGHLGARLGHPHICGVSDIGRLDDGSPYVVMERLQGRTVAEHLQRSGVLPVMVALRLAEQLVSALAVAHAEGIVHRDVKAPNVFMTEVHGLAPLAKLLDFGVALCPSALLPRSLDDAQVITNLTAAGVVVGTPQYMSPEQAAGRRDLDARSDLYQVGVFLYEALTAAVPCSAPTHGEVLRKIVRGDLTPLASVDPAIPAVVIGLVDRAIATSREDRFQTAAELLDALGAVAQAVAHRGDPSGRDVIYVESDPTTRVRPPPSAPPRVGRGGDTGVTLPVAPRERIR
jgi:eukaryotic-like serine/threonine-protein kinase